MTALFYVFSVKIDRYKACLNEYKSAANLRYEFTLEQDRLALHLHQKFLVLQSV